jgi:hypothetical protein
MVNARVCQADRGLVDLKTCMGESNACVVIEHESITVGGEGVSDYWSAGCV